MASIDVASVATRLSELARIPGSLTDEQVVSAIEAFRDILRHASAQSQGQAGLQECTSVLGSAAIFLRQSVVSGLSCGSDEAALAKRREIRGNPQDAFSRLRKLSSAVILRVLKWRNRQRAAPSPQPGTQGTTGQPSSAARPVPELPLADLVSSIPAIFDCVQFELEPMAVECTHLYFDILRELKAGSFDTSKVEAEYRKGIEFLKTSLEGFSSIWKAVAIGSEEPEGSRSYLVIAEFVRNFSLLLSTFPRFHSNLEPIINILQNVCKLPCGQLCQPPSSEPSEFADSFFVNDPVETLGLSREEILTVGTPQWQNLLSEADNSEPCPTWTAVLPAYLNGSSAVWKRSYAHLIECLCRVSNLMLDVGRTSRLDVLRRICGTHSSKLLANAVAAHGAACDNYPTELDESVDADVLDLSRTTQLRSVVEKAAAAFSEEMRTYIDDLHCEASIERSYLQQVVPFARVVIRHISIGVQAAAPRNRCRHGILDLVHRCVSTTKSTGSFRRFSRLSADMCFEVMRSDNADNAILALKVLSELFADFRDYLKLIMPELLTIIREQFFRMQTVAHKRLGVTINSTIPATYTAQAGSGDVQMRDSVGGAVAAAASVKVEGSSQSAQSAGALSGGEEPAVLMATDSFQVVADSISLLPSVLTTAAEVSQQELQWVVDSMKLTARQLISLKELRYQAAYNEYFSMMVKTAFVFSVFLRWRPTLLGGGNEQERLNAVRFIPEFVCELFRRCPDEPLSNRSDLFHLLRGLADSNLRTGLLRYVDSLLDRRVLLGRTRASYDVHRSNGYIVMLDVMYHLRKDLSFAQLCRVVQIAVALMADSSFSLGFQHHCVKILFRLTETICMQNDEHGRSRFLLILMLRAYVLKVKWLSEVQSGDRALHDESLHILPEHNDGLREARHMLRMLIVGLDHLMKVFTIASQAAQRRQFEAARARAEASGAAGSGADAANPQASRSSSAADRSNAAAPGASAHASAASVAAAQPGGGATRADIPHIHAFVLSLEESSIFTTLFKHGVLAFRMFPKPCPRLASKKGADGKTPKVETGSEEELKDGLDKFASIFAALEPVIFRDVFRDELLDLLYHEIKHSSRVVLTIPAHFFTEVQISRERGRDGDVAKRFTDIMVKYLVKKLEKEPAASAKGVVKADDITQLAEDDDDKSDPAVQSVLMLLFKLVFGSISQFPLHEAVLKPHVQTIVRNCLRCAREAKNPIKYYLILRGLCKCVVDANYGAGNFEDLLKDYMHLVPEILKQVTVFMSSTSRKKHLENLVELCLLTVHARGLLITVEWLHLLRQPILHSLHLREDLQALGLTTLELLVDNVKPVLLDLLLRPIYSELMVALQRLLRPGPVANGPHAFRILAKLGGRNRKTIQEPALDMVDFTEYGMRVRFRLPAGMLRGPLNLVMGNSPSDNDPATDIVLQLNQIINLARSVLTSTVDSHNRLYSFRFLKACLISMLNVSSTASPLLSGDKAVDPLTAFCSDGSPLAEELQRRLGQIQAVWEKLQKDRPESQQGNRTVALHQMYHVNTSSTINVYAGHDLRAMYAYKRYRSEGEPLPTEDESVVTHDFLEAQSTVLKLIITSLVLCTSDPVLESEARSFLRGVSRHFAILFARQSSRPLRSGGSSPSSTDPVHLNAELFMDAVTEVICSDSLREAGRKVLIDFADDLVVLSGLDGLKAGSNEVVDRTVYTDRMVLVWRILAARFAHCCFKYEWADKLGGIAGIQILTEKMPEPVLRAHVAEFVKALLFVLKHSADHVLPVTSGDAKRTLMHIVKFICSPWQKKPEATTAAADSATTGEGTASTVAGTDKIPEEALSTRTTVLNLLLYESLNVPCVAARQCAQELLVLITKLCNETLQATISMFTEGLCKSFQDTTRFGQMESSKQRAYMDTLTFFLSQSPPFCPINADEVDKLVRVMLDVMKLDNDEQFRRLRDNSEALLRAESALKFFGRVLVWPPYIERHEARMRQLISSQGGNSDPVAAAAGSGGAAVDTSSLSSVNSTSREEVLEFFFKCLALRLPCLQDGAKENLREVIEKQRVDKTLLQRCLRPILNFLGDLTTLSLDVLQSLAHALELCRSYFSVKLAEQLIEFARQFGNPEKIRQLTLAPAQPQPGAGGNVRKRRCSWRPGEEPHIAAAILNLFHILPSEAMKFLHVCVDLVQKLESAWREVCTARSSPFRPPLARFVNKHPTLEAIPTAAGGQGSGSTTIVSVDPLTYFLQRVLLPQSLELFVWCLKSEDGPNIRLMLSQRPQLLVQQTFKRAQALKTPGAVPEVTAPPAPGSAPAQMQPKDGNSRPRVVGVRSTDADRLCRGGLRVLKVLLKRTRTMDKLEKDIYDYDNENELIDFLNQMWLELVEQAHFRTIEERNRRLPGTLSQAQFFEFFLEGIAQYKYIKPLIKCLLCFLRSPSRKPSVCPKAIPVLFNLAHIYAMYEDYECPQEFLLVKKFFVEEVPTMYDAADKKLLLAKFVELLHTPLTHVVNQVASTYQRGHPIITGKMKVVVLQDILFPSMSSAMEKESEADVIFTEEVLKDLFVAGNQGRSMLMFPQLVVNSPQPNGARRDRMLELVGVHHKTTMLVELVQFAGLLIRHLPQKLHPLRKATLHFAWDQVKNTDTDPVLKACQYHTVCTFVEAYDTPLKPLQHWYMQLLREHSSDTRQHVEHALDILIPSLPKRTGGDVPGGNFPPAVSQTVSGSLSPAPTRAASKIPIWVKWTKVLLLEEGHRQVQMQHIVNAMGRQRDRFKPYRDVFLKFILHSIFRLGNVACSSSSNEPRQQVLMMIELLLDWYPYSDADAVAGGSGSGSGAQSERPEADSPNSKRRKVEGASAVDQGPSESAFSVESKGEVLTLIVRIAHSICGEFIASSARPGGNSQAAIAHVTVRKCIDLLRSCVYEWSPAVPKYSHVDRMLAWACTEVAKVKEGAVGALFESAIFSVLELLGALLEKQHHKFLWSGDDYKMLGTRLVAFAATGHVRVVQSVDLIVQRLLLHSDLLLAGTAFEHRPLQHPLFAEIQAKLNLHFSKAVMKGGKDTDYILVFGPLTVLKAIVAHFKTKKMPCRYIDSSMMAHLVQLLRKMDNRIVESGNITEAGGPSSANPAEKRRGGSGSRGGNPRSGSNAGTSRSGGDAHRETKDARIGQLLFRLTGENIIYYKEHMKSFMQSFVFVISKSKNTTVWSELLNLAGAWLLPNLPKPMYKGGGFDEEKAKSGGEEESSGDTAMKDSDAKETGSPAAPAQKPEEGILSLEEETRILGVIHKALNSLSRPSQRTHQISVEDLQVCFYMLLCNIFKYKEFPSQIKRREYIERIRTLFILGLKVADANVRGEILGVLHEILPKNLYDRMRYIFDGSNWELLADNFWLRHAIELLVRLFDGALPLATAFHGVLLPPVAGSPTAQDNGTPTNSPAVEAGDDDAGDTEMEESGNATEESGEATTAGATVALSESQLELLAAHEKFLKDVVANTAVSALINPLCDLCRESTLVTYHLWVPLFSQLWELVDDTTRTRMEYAVTDMLKKDWHLRQNQKLLNVIQALLEGFERAKHPVQLPYELIKYLGKSFRAWHVAVPLIERLHLDVDEGRYLADELNASEGLAGNIVRKPDAFHRSDEEHRVRGYEALADFYRLLSEDDMLVGVWRVMGVSRFSKTILSLEQVGWWNRAVDTTLHTINQFQMGNVNNVSRSEVNLWDQKLVECARHMQDWDNLQAVAKSPEYSQLNAEFQWKTGQWDQLMTSVRNNDVVDGVQAKVYRISCLIMEEKTKDAEELCMQTIDEAIYSWWSLPNVHSGTHVQMLHRFQQIQELYESARILREVSRCQQTFKAISEGTLRNQNVREHEVVHACLQRLQDSMGHNVEYWRMRMPNTWDDITMWNDMLTWRTHMWTRLEQSLLSLCKLGATVSVPHLEQRDVVSSLERISTVGKRETAWMLCHYARHARKQGLYDVCVTALENATGLLDTKPGTPATTSRPALLNFNNLVSAVHRIQSATGSTPNPNTHSITRETVDFYRVYEKAKCFRAHPFTWPTGLEELSQIRIDPYSPKHQARLLCLKGEFLARLQQEKKSYESYSNAITAHADSGKPWLRWARFCDHVFMRTYEENELDIDRVVKEYDAQLATAQAAEARSQPPSGAPPSGHPSASATPAPQAAGGSGSTGVPGSEVAPPPPVPIASPAVSMDTNNRATRTPGSHLNARLVSLKEARQSVYQWADEAITCYMHAVLLEYDHMARMHLSRVLWLTGILSNISLLESHVQNLQPGHRTLSIKLYLEKVGADMPAWMWLSCLPHLFQCLHRPEGLQVKHILQKLAYYYPQSIYYNVRAFLFEVSDQVERLNASTELRGESDSGVGAPRSTAALSAPTPPPASDASSTAASIASLLKPCTLPTESMPVAAIDGVLSARLSDGVAVVTVTIDKSIGHQALVALLCSKWYVHVPTVTIGSSAATSAKDCYLVGVASGVSPNVVDASAEPVLSADIRIPVEGASTERVTTGAFSFLKHWFISPSKAEYQSKVEQFERQLQPRSQAGAGDLNIAALHYSRKHCEELMTHIMQNNQAFGKEADLLLQQLQSISLGGSELHDELKRSLEGILMECYRYSPNATVPKSIERNLRELHFWKLMYPLRCLTQNPAVRQMLSTTGGSAANLAPNGNGGSSTPSTLNGNDAGAASAAPSGSTTPAAGPTSSATFGAAVAAARPGAPAAAGTQSGVSQSHNVPGRRTTNQAFLLMNMRNTFEKELLHSCRGDIRGLTTHIRKWLTAFGEHVAKISTIIALDRLSSAPRWLLEGRIKEMEIPGQYLDFRVEPQVRRHERLQSFLPEVDVVQRNLYNTRRIHLRSDVGHEYQFIIQSTWGAIQEGSSEERMWYICRVVNDLLEKRRESRRRSLKVHVPKIIPFTAHLRLVEDERGYFSLLDTYEEHICRRRQPIDLPIMEHWKRLEKEERLATLAGSSMEAARLRVFDDVCKKFVPHTLLTDYVRRCNTSWAEFYQFRWHVTKQLAVSSVLSHLCSIQDRAPYRMYFAKRSGTVIHYNFHPKYTAEGRLAPPEQVPLRLTRNLLHFMTPVGVEGKFLADATATVYSLDYYRDILRHYLSLYILDDLFMYKSVRTSSLDGSLSSGETPTAQDPIQLYRHDRHVRARVEANVQVAMDRLDELSLSKRAAEVDAAAAAESISVNAAGPSTPSGHSHSGPASGRQNTPHRPEHRPEPALGSSVITDPINTAVEGLIHAAMDPKNLSNMPPSWYPWL